MLYALFSSKTRVSLLRLFLKNPEKEYYLREISRYLNESTTPIRRELINLRKIGFLSDNKVANLIYYKANKEFIFFRELQDMIKKAEHTMKNGTL